jgi:hypothetical protein
MLRPLAAGLLVLAAACGSNPPPGSVNYDRNRISASEVQDALSRNITNAWDLIQSARPMWLRQASTGLGGSAQQIVVFENTTRLGGITALRNMPLSNVSAIRWLSPSEAGGEFGTDVNYGAIQIITNTGR